jgi:hypothetical protein
MSTIGTDAHLARIKRALERIESAATPTSSPGADHSALDELQQKHDLLRAETAEALTALDTIIAKIGPRGGQS